MGHVRRKRKNNKHITDTKVYTSTYGSSEFSVRGGVLQKERHVDARGRFDRTRLPSII